MVEKKVRAHLIISGRVQGVFFRAETRGAAQRFGVQGWVRNQADGTVEALLEGTEDSVRQAIEWCRQGPPRARVTDVQIAWEAYRGEFDGFAITH